MYEKDGIKYVSPFEWWNLPERDLSGMPEAVEFAVGLNGQMACDNPVGMDLEWTDGNVEVRM